MYICMYGLCEYLTCVFCVSRYPYWSYEISHVVTQRSCFDVVQTSLVRLNIGVQCVEICGCLCGVYASLYCGMFPSVVLWYGFFNTHLTWFEARHEATLCVSFGNLANNLLEYYGCQMDVKWMCVIVAIQLLLIPFRWLFS